ncbi:MAG: short-chain dehydrogenase [Legionellales bacterium]|nr:short-chain dehydrogenase [Legionellales bacterium]|tara:strand:+ start:259 stop:1158 length:900 start_codon:yes stop_codon:yes gene_type:complete
MDNTLLPIEKRAVLVTGASTGIGYHAACTLKQRGYQVFAAARKTDDVQRLAAEGFNAIRMDMQDSASIHLGVEQVLRQTQNRLYGLFNNAGFGQPGAVEDVSRDALRAQFETNVFGLHELTCAVIPVMREQGYGRIIQNSSILGFVGLAYRGAYNSSKFALEGLTDTMRVELSNTPIKVSIIQPGPIVSKFRENAYQKFRENIDQNNSYHQKTYHLVTRRLSEGSDDPYTLGPEAVTNAVIHALESKRPKIRYRITKPTIYMAWLKRLLSERRFDRLVKHVMESEIKEAAKNTNQNKES